MSQEIRDRHLVYERETDHSHVGFDSKDNCCSMDDPKRVDPYCQTTRDVPSIDEKWKQENQNAEVEVEEPKQKENSCAVEGDKYPSEEPKACCGLNDSDKEGCCGATGDGPLNEEYLAGDNCCEDNNTHITSCCDLGFLKQHENQDGACCDGKWSNLLLRLRF